MASHMDLLAASRVIDKNIDPEAGHMLIDEGDYTSFQNKAEIMHRAKSSPDLVARASGMLGDDRSRLEGAADPTALLDPNATHNENNARVHRRMQAEARKGIAPRRYGQVPASSDTDGIALAVEGSNRDEGGGSNVGALGSIPKADEVLAEAVPPKPTTEIVWKKNV